jgi:acyl-coenzyme A synthetase/AMP-(fatty) acid ligase
VAERVAPHKRLEQGVMFVESLPKNQTGKLLRRELKAQVRGIFPQQRLYLLIHPQVFKGSFGY